MLNEKAYSLRLRSEGRIQARNYDQDYIKFVFWCTGG